MKGTGILVLPVTFSYRSYRAALAVDGLCQDHVKSPDEKSGSTDNRLMGPGEWENVGRYMRDTVVLNERNEQN